MHVFSECQTRVSTAENPQDVSTYSIQLTTLSIYTEHATVTYNIYRVMVEPCRSGVVLGLLQLTTHTFPRMAGCTILTMMTRIHPVQAKVQIDEHGDMILAIDRRSDRM
jgi:hypothetical protein